MKLKFRKLLPDKKQTWNFVFVIAGAFVVFMFIDSKAIELSQSWSEQQETIRQKTEFVENLSVLGFGRIYHAEVYYLNKTGGESSEVVERSFQFYMESVTAWNRHNVLNSIFLEKHFGEEVKDDYNGDLLPKLVELHNIILAARDGQSVDNFQEVLEETKNKMWTFNERLYIEDKQ